MNVREKAKSLRYKKAIIEHLNLYDIENELSELSETADNVLYSWADENLLEALDGDEEELWELKIAMSELSSDCERLYTFISSYEVSEHFDDFFVSLAMHDRPPIYRMVGFDSYEMDYFGFMSDCEEELAETESIKRLKRLTKDELLKTAGECFRVILFYLDIREKINSLGSVIEAIQDGSRTILEAVKNVEALYEETAKIKFRPYAKETEDFNRTLKLIPDRVWIE